MSRIPNYLIESLSKGEGKEVSSEQLREWIGILVKIVDGGELDFGYPDDGTGTPGLFNIRGQWVTVQITNANQLGNGAAAPVTFTHNMNLPVVTNSNGDARPNVTPAIVRITHGDPTGVNAPPTPHAAKDIFFSLHFRFGDACTANSIDLRVASGVNPSATEPINFDVFFHPAVQ